VYASAEGAKLIFHREVMLSRLQGFGAVTGDVKIVHIDGNNLNNRKSNLKIVFQRSNEQKK
jgi:hypothetical protein